MVSNDKAATGGRGGDRGGDRDRNMTPLVPRPNDTKLVEERKAYISRQNEIQKVLKGLDPSIKETTKRRDGLIQEIKQVRARMNELEDQRRLIRGERNEAKKKEREVRDSKQAAMKDLEGLASQLPKQVKKKGPSEVIAENLAFIDEEILRLEGEYAGVKTNAEDKAITQQITKMAAKKQLVKEYEERAKMVFSADSNQSTESIVIPDMGQINQELDELRVKYDTIQEQINKVKEECDPLYNQRRKLNGEYGELKGKIQKIKQELDGMYEAYREKVKERKKVENERRKVEREAKLERKRAYEKAEAERKEKERLYKLSLPPFFEEINLCKAAIKYLTPMAPKEVKQGKRGRKDTLLDHEKGAVDNFKKLGVDAPIFASLVPDLISTIEGKLKDYEAKSEEEKKAREARKAEEVPAEASVEKDEPAPPAAEEVAQESEA